MKRASTTAFAVLVAALVVAVPAWGADELTRDEYVATIEPICKRDKEAGERILSGVQERIRDDKLTAAGNQLIRASDRFGVTIGKIVAVPRPAADEEKLQKWFRFLRIVKTRLGKTGRLYKQGKEIEATHESIRAERSGNAANNVSFSLGARDCRLSRSRYG